MAEPMWRQLDIAVIGGGIGGFAVATSLRRAGHKVTIYERAHYAGEVGASISCAANGTRWLEDWNVNIEIGKPVILKSLIRHDWSTGEVIDTYDLKDYKETWGYVYYMFHRVNLHEMLMDSATGEGSGIPAKLVLDHKCVDIDLDAGVITFKNGSTAHHDMVVGADGIGSVVRSILGVKVQKTRSRSACLHCIITSDKVKELGLVDYTVNNAIEYWGGQGIHKIVYSPCRYGQINSFYCFSPLEFSKSGNEGWNYEATVEELLEPYGDLDKNLLAIFKNSWDIKPWRLWVHEPYTHWHKGVACIMGDAAHPMMPDQSQGACQAIEDAAALGIIFSKDFGFTQDIQAGLELYQRIRKPRATRVQAASARARENITERIGFSSNTKNPTYRVASEKDKLTIEEMNLYDMKIDISQQAASLTRARI
ncbi:hypothetical protein PV04_07671 [Phialophora macrospora]|uniref:FAD-binding domain-containing protein n=1 Tax=Phialophora macrospora TaxID=1851006 RepID=A0A0D2FBL7_9EURO|nr:hypothetical protein PV04_07671 [Phialophora macrospora]